ncbi:MAG: hypothetical protein OXD01_10545 [Gammaproteobacteria bacterium]|nr:hypothetical protein [Gammaproteobacteria bacterium]
MAELEQAPVNGKGCQRSDPGYIEQDDIHKKLASHQKDAIAETISRRGIGFGSNQEQLNGTKAQAICIGKPWQHLR